MRIVGAIFAVILITSLAEGKTVEDIHPTRFDKLVHADEKDSWFVMFLHQVGKGGGP